MKPFLYGLAGAIVALVGTASFQARASMSPSDLQPPPAVQAAGEATALSAAAAPLSIRCQPGEQPVVRQELVNGRSATVAECAPLAALPVLAPASLAAPSLAARQPGVVPVSYEEPAPVRRVVRRESRPTRNWAKTALVIGGSAGTGAGIGGLAGGKKGALIGAAIGGGAATLFEALKK